MLAMAAEYDRKNRFQFNGKKSGVMVFNTTPQVRASGMAENRELFGEAVQVVDEYEYLGTITCTDDADWNKHVAAVIERAERR